MVRMKKLIGMNLYLVFDKDNKPKGVLGKIREFIKEDFISIPNGIYNGDYYIYVEMLDNVDLVTTPTFPTFEIAFIHAKGVICNEEK